MLKITRQGDNVFEVEREDGNRVSFTKEQLKTSPYRPDLASFAGGGPVIDPAEALEFMTTAHQVAREHAIEHHIIEEF